MDREDCWFVDLAEELVLRIAAWLPIPAIVAFSATNQRLHRLCHDPILCREVTLDGAALRKKPTGTTFRELAHAFPEVREINLVNCEHLVNADILELCWFDHLELFSISPEPTRTIPGTQLNSLTTGGISRVFHWTIANRLCADADALCHVAATKPREQRDAMYRAACGKLWDALWVIRDSPKKSEYCYEDDVKNKKEVLPFPKPILTIKRDKIAQRMNAIQNSGDLISPVYGSTLYRSPEVLTDCVALWPNPSQTAQHNLLALTASERGKVLVWTMDGKLVTELQCLADDTEISHIATYRNHVAVLQENFIYMWELHADTPGFDEGHEKEKKFNSDSACVTRRLLWSYRFAGKSRSAKKRSRPLWMRPTSRGLSVSIYCAAGDGDTTAAKLRVTALFTKHILHLDADTGEVLEIINFNVNKSSGKTGDLKTYTNQQWSTATGDVLLCSCNDAVVRVFRAVTSTTGPERKTWFPPERHIEIRPPSKVSNSFGSRSREIALNHDGSLAALALKNGEVTIWDTQRGTLTCTIRHKHASKYLAFLTDTVIASVTKKGDIYISRIPKAEEGIPPAVLQTQDGDIAGKRRWLSLAIYPHPELFINPPEPVTVAATILEAESVEWRWFEASFGSNSPRAIEATIDDCVRGEGDPTVAAPAVFMQIGNGSLFVSGGQTQLGRYTYRYGTYITTVLSPLEGSSDSKSPTLQLDTQLPLMATSLDRHGRFIAGISDKSYVVFNVATKALVFETPIHPHPPPKEAWCFTPNILVLPYESTDNRNAPYVVVNCNTSGADVIDTATGEKKFHFGEGLMFTTTVIDPTFRYLLTGAVVSHLGQCVVFDFGSPGALRPPNIPSAEPVRCMLGSSFTTTEPSSCAFSPDGSTVCSGHAGAAVLEMKYYTPLAHRHFILNRRPLEDEPRGSESIRCVHWSNDGKWLACLEQGSRGPWGLPLCNTLLRVFRAEIDWPVVACYDVASLATTFCWKEDDSGFWIGLGAGSVTSLLFTPLF